MKIYKNNSTIDRINKLIFKKNTTDSYLPLIRESFDEKVMRIYQDRSFIYEEDMLNKSKSNFKLIKNIFIGHKIAFEPLSNKILAWYLALALAIFFLFFETTLILTYGSIV